MPEEVHLDDVDGMLFLATYIEDQLDLLDAVENPTMGDMFSISGMGFEGVADICREQIAQAQAGLDRLIEADTTWRPA